MKTDHKECAKGADYLQMSRCQEELKVLYQQAKIKIQKVQKKNTKESLRKKQNKKIKICGNIILWIYLNISK